MNALAGERALLLAAELTARRAPRSSMDASPDRSAPSPRLPSSPSLRACVPSRIRRRSRTFAPAKLAAIAPLMLDRDIVLIELDGAGHLRQLTTLTMVAAPPAAVREVVIHPEKYADFVRNMKRSRVAVEPGGTLRHDYAISYRFYTVEGAHRYVFIPKRPGTRSRRSRCTTPTATARGTIVGSSYPRAAARCWRCTATRRSRTTGSRRATWRRRRRSSPASRSFRSSRSCTR